MGLTTDLKLEGNDFSNIATFLFVGLLCFEIPNSKPHPPSPSIACEAPLMSHPALTLDGS